MNPFFLFTKSNPVDQASQCKQLKNPKYGQTGYCCTIINKQPFNISQYAAHKHNSLFFFFHLFTKKSVTTYVWKVFPVCQKPLMAFEVQAN